LVRPSDPSNVPSVIVILDGLADGLLLRLRLCFPDDWRTTAVEGGGGARSRAYGLFVAAGRRRAEKGARRMCKKKARRSLSKAPNVAGFGVVYDVGGGGMAMREGGGERICGGGAAMPVNVMTRSDEDEDPGGFVSADGIETLGWACRISTSCQNPNRSWNVVHLSVGTGISRIGGNRGY
jgi:hypothetical protein